MYFGSFLPDSLSSHLSPHVLVVLWKQWYGHSSDEPAGRASCGPLHPNHPPELERLPVHEAGGVRLPSAWWASQTHTLHLCTHNQSIKIKLTIHFCSFLSRTDPADVQYRQNEVTPVDYLKFKHHSYSEMVAVSMPAHEHLNLCWVLLYSQRTKLK